MLKFSRYRSGTLSDRWSPENRKSKRQRIETGAGDDNNTSPEAVVNKENNSRLNSEIQRLTRTHGEFEKFLDMVSSDLSEKVEKQKLLKETDKNYAGVQLFMLTKYRNRIDRFRQVSKNNLDNILDTARDKENTEQDTILEYVNKHIETVGKMKRRSKQILDISDKYAVEDIFDNINLVNECSASLVPASSIPSSTGHSKMSKWRSIGVLSAKKVEPVSAVPGVEEPVSIDDVSLRTSSTRTSRSSTSSTSRHSKLSTFLSLTDHLAVLTKTYTGRR